MKRLHSCGSELDVNTARGLLFIDFKVPLHLPGSSIRQYALVQFYNCYRAIVHVGAQLILWNAHHGHSMKEKMIEASEAHDTAMESV